MPSTSAALADILFRQGFGTRRDCAGLVAQGRVRLPGGPPFDDPAARLATDGLVLEVDGTAWPVCEPACVLLHKPAGWECSQKPSAWPSVMNLLPPPLRRRGVQPVGRLDQDTTGLLLLTDDGGLIHRLTSPRHHVPKVYEVQTARPVDAAQVAALCSGVRLRDEPQPLRAEAAEATGPQSLRLTLVQGKYHQVKRMVAAVGNHCRGLHRSAFGPLRLDPQALPAGQWRWLGADEVAALRVPARSAGGVQSNAERRG